MIKVFFESSTHAELVATFETIEMFTACFPSLRKRAIEQGMILQVVDEEQEWETECEHQQEVDLGIHDDYLDRIGN
tara:strand:- start:274 stop:501 length:228 start_codon:yes stop_codon:yes gene_type:complete